MNKKIQAERRREAVKELRLEIAKLTNPEDIKHVAEIARRMYAKSQLKPKGDITDD